MRTRLFASALALSSLLVAGAASAQDPTAAPPASAATTTPTAPPAATPPAAPAAAPLSDEEADEKGRLWIGFDLGGGVGNGANISGPAFDGAFRAGWVFNHLMSAYANLTGLAWVGAAASSSSSGQSAGFGAISAWFITPMFSLTPADLVEVAAGPSLDFVSGGSTSATVSSTGGSASANAFSGAYFGAQGRVALHLGGRNAETRRRRGFTISLDVHPDFVPGGPVTFITGGLGADWF